MEMNSKLLSHIKYLNKIQVRTLDSIYIVCVKNIIRCEAYKNYTTIFLRDEKSILVSHTLKDFETLLPFPDFMRIHQSHLVNCNYIKRISKQDSCILLTDNSKIPISNRKHDLINEYLKMLPTIRHRVKPLLDG